MSRPRTSAVKRILLRYPNELLAVLSAGFILQAGLVPFDIQWESVVAFNANDAPPSPLHDLVANVFLFLPLGLFVQACLCRVVSGAMAYFLTVLSALLLSGVIECAQAYSPSRISSLIDVGANVGGAILGGMLSVFMRTIVPNLIGAALFEFRVRPSAATLKTYVLLLVILGAMPFTFAFDAPRFKQAVRQTVLVPFGHSLLKEDIPAQPDARESDLIAWNSTRRVLRWSAEAASFALLAWLLQIVLRGEYAFASRSAATLTLWMGGVFALGLSAGQFLVITRGLDTTDVVFRITGLGVGLLSWNRIRRFALSAPLSWLPCRAGALCIAGWIVTSGLAPFRFQSPHESVFAPLTSAAFVPFMAYFETRADLMLTDVLEKVVAYALLAGFMVGGWASLRRCTTSVRLIRVTAIGVILSAMVEAAQVFLPVRVVSLTELILAAVGCLLGLMLAEHVAAFVEFVKTRRVLGPEPCPIAFPALDKLSPAERLMSTLSDAYDDAPKEPVGTPLDSSSRKGRTSGGTS